MIERREGKESHAVGSVVRVVGGQLEVEGVLGEDIAIEKFLKKRKFTGMDVFSLKDVKRFIKYLRRAPPITFVGVLKISLSSYFTDHC